MIWGFMSGLSVPFPQSAFCLQFTMKPEKQAMTAANATITFIRWAINQGKPV